MKYKSVRLSHPTGLFYSTQASTSIPHFSGTRSIRYLLYIVMLSTSLAYRLSSNSVKNSNTSFALASAAVMDFPENKAKEEFEDE